MCGIVGYVGSKEACPVLVDGLKRLEYRGYDSAGVALLSGSEFIVRRCKGKISSLETLVGEDPPSGNIGIGHTRWATHGKPSDENAHPHCAGSFVVVHNGIIENYKEIRQELESEGREFNTQTDTEVIPHLLDYIYSTDGGDITLVIRKALSKLKGSYALAILCKNDPNVIYAAKRANPLIIGIGKDENFVASDVPALLSYTREIIVLEDGDIARISADKIKIEDYSGKEVSRSSRVVPWTPLMAEKGGYRHFMLKEIHEQPRAISDTLAGRYMEEPPSILYDDVFEHFENIDQIDNFLFLACGTSYHAAMAGVHLMETIAGVHAEADLASEFRYRNAVIPPKTMCVFISQSGETADTLAALDAVKERGIPCLGICNVVDAGLARKSDAVIYTHAGPEIGVASTKAFITQLVVLYMLSIYIAVKKGKVNEGETSKLIKGLLHLPALVEEVLESESDVERIAKKYFKEGNFLFLGRGDMFPIAMEGALKLKEISYIHAEGYAGGEIKHGPLALVDEHMPVVVVATDGPLKEKILSNMEEVKTRGGKLIALASKGDKDIEKVAEDVIFIPQCDPLFAPVATAVPLQLLAYHIAVLRGTDVDQPRNLAKSVTVE